MSNENWADAANGWGWVSGFAWWLAVSISTLVLGLAMVWLGQGALRAAERAIREHLGAAAGWGVIIEFLMPIVAKDVGLTAANPRFSYAAPGSDGFTGDFDFLGENADGTVAANAGRFNAFNSAVSTGAFATLAPRARTSVPLTINAAEFAATPALGVMVVGMENFSGKAEASLLRFERGEDDED